MRSRPPIHIERLAMTGLMPCSASISWPFSSSAALSQVAARMRQRPRCSSSSGGAGSLAIASSMRSGNTSSSPAFVELGWQATATSWRLSISRWRRARCDHHPPQYMPA